MFEVNYATAIVGADVAYVTHGFTAQAETTLLQSVRVRGDETAAGADAFRTRATIGAHVGMFLGRHVSVGADLEYRRWLSHPTMLDAMADPRVPSADEDRATFTASIGARVHIHLGAVSIHPGLSYTRGLDGFALHGPMNITKQTNAVALAIPVLERELDVDLLMVVAAIGAAAIGYWFDGALLIFIFALSGTLEGYASARTQRDLESLMSLNPHEATVLRDGGEVRLAVEALCIGDIVIVKPGERVPADGQILDGTSLVDQASITGEATPAHKQIGDEVFAGTINGQGGLRVRVSKPAGETVLARIIATVREAQERRPPAQLFIERFERIYAKVVVLGAVLFVAIPILALGWTFAAAWYRAMVFLVVASPCALAASMMPALLSALSNGARNGVLFKGSTYVEALGHVRAIAFDKTGTLTTGHPSVVEVLGDEGVDVAVLVSRSAAVEAMSEHPIGAAIVAEARRREVGSAVADGFRSAIGVGASATVAGVWWQVGKAEMFSSVPDQLRLAKERLEGAGDTVVLVGDQRAQGLFAVRDTLRANAVDAVRALRQLGIEHVAVLTGDSQGAADVVATAVGADQVHAGLLPGDKVRIVEQLLARYGAVAVVGDGVNDAPALATATVGIAMGAAGTDVALDTADVVLMADDVGRIPYAIKLGRRALRVVKQNVVVAVSVMVLLVVADVLGRITLPAGVVGHEGSTLLVTISGLRLLLQVRT